MSMIVVFNLKILLCTGNSGLNSSIQVKFIVLKYSGKIVCTSCVFKVPLSPIVRETRCPLASKHSCNDTLITQTVSSPELFLFAISPIKLAWGSRGA